MIEYKNETFRSIRVILSNESAGKKEFVHVPDGWRDAGYSFQRSTQYFGVFREYAINKLGFVKGAKAFIEGIVESQGFDAEITIDIYEFDFVNYTWELQFNGTLDLITKDQDDIKFTVAVLDSSFESKFMNREDVEIIVSELTTIDGFQLEGFTNEKTFITLPERRDFLNNTLSNPRTNTDNVVDILTGDNREYAFALKVDTFEDEDKVKDSTGGKKGANFSVANAFVVNPISSPEFETVVNYDILFQTGQNKSETDRNVQLVLFLVDSSDTLIQSIPIPANKVITPTVSGNDIVSYSALGSITVDIPELAYLQLGLIFYNSSFTIELFANQAKTDLTVRTESTGTGQIQVESWLAHEFGSRIAQNITGKQTAFYSEFLGRTDSEIQSYPFDGDFGLLAFTNGGLIRGFGIDEFPLSGSFKKFFDSINSIVPIGVGIEEINGNKVIRLENRQYFYDSRVALTLENCSNVQHEFDDSLIFNAVKFGFKKGETDELRENIFDYNTSSEWANNVKSVKSDLSLISDYAASNAQINNARQLPKQTNPTTDSKYDEINYMVDLVRSDAGNLINNPNFDNGTADWTIRAVMVQNFLGSNRAFVNNNFGGSPGLLLQDITPIGAPNISLSYSLVLSQQDFERLRDDDRLEFSPTVQVTAETIGGDTYSLNSNGDWVLGAASIFMPIIEGKTLDQIQSLNNFQIQANTPLANIASMFISFDTEFMDVNAVLDGDLIIDDVFVSSSAKFTARTDEGFTKVENIINPTESYNVRLSPGNSLERYGYILRAFLEKSLNSNYTFSKSEKDSSMISQLVGGREIDEKGNVLVNDLEQPIYKPEKISFEAPIALAQKRELNGFFDDGKSKRTGLIKWREKDTDDYQFGWIQKFEDGGTSKTSRASFELLPISQYVNVVEEVLAIDDDNAIFTDDDGASFVIE